jgi:hypothetical protein
MKVLATLIVFTLVTTASGKEEGFRFLPPGLQFFPLRAAIPEARIGLFKFLDASEMKVDIGNTIDVFGYETPSWTLTAGIDFMAYALTTGAQGLRLQIDAVDGLFGGNLTASHTSGLQTLQIRLRLLHHSAHLVDGHYLTEEQRWIDNRVPIPYTQDFGDLVVASVVRPSFGVIRSYAGVSYATLVRPDVLRRAGIFGGMELVFKGLAGSVDGQPASPYLAYTLTLDGAPTYIGSQFLQAGMKFGEWFGKGPSLYFGFYSGRHMFGEYFNERLTTVGAGFTVDFF